MYIFSVHNYSLQQDNSQLTLCNLVCTSSPITIVTTDQNTPQLQVRQNRLMFKLAFQLISQSFILINSTVLIFLSLYAQQSILAVLPVITKSTNNRQHQ